MDQIILLFGIQMIMMLVLFVFEKNIFHKMKIILRTNCKQIEQEQHKQDKTKEYVIFSSICLI